MPHFHPFPYSSYSCPKIRLSVFPFSLSFPSLELKPALIKGAHILIGLFEQLHFNTDIRTEVTI